MSHNSNTEEKMDASEAEKAESPAATDTNNDTNNNADPVMASPVKKDGTNTTTVASDEHHQPNEEEEEKKESSAEKKRPLAENDTTVPRKPIKRARTAYFIFAEERRPEVQKQHPGEGVAAVGKALGQLWGSLTTEEKQVYQNKAAEERERVAKDIEAWKKANGGDAAWAKAISKPQNSTDPWSLAYPFAKIRKICKLDPDVKNLSKEALLLVTKAAELATAKLGLESFQVAQMQNRRKLLPEDVAMVCRSRGQFTFLKNDVVDLVKEQKKELNQQAGNNAHTKASKKVVAAPTTSNPISSYFAPKKNS